MRTTGYTVHPLQFLAKSSYKVWRYRTNFFFMQFLLLKPIFDSNPQSRFLTPRSGKIGVCHATFGYGRPPRSVGPLGLAVEIVSIGYGPVPHRIWGPGAAATRPSHVLKRHQDRLTLLTDVTRSFPTTTAASHSSEKQLKLRKRHKYTFV